MVKAYFDSLLEEATIMAAVNNGFGRSGSNTSNGMIDIPADGKEEPSDSYARVTLPLHLETNSSAPWKVRRDKVDSEPLFGQSHSRPTRESVLKRLYDALMRRSLVKVSQEMCLNHVVA